MTLVSDSWTTRYAVSDTAGSRSGGVPLRAARPPGRLADVLDERLDIVEALRGRPGSVVGVLAEHPEHRPRLLQGLAARVGDDLEALLSGVRVGSDHVCTHPGLHSMSLIAVQAGVGAHVIRTDPDAAEQSLEVIADTSRKALEQTRSMLGMLRAGTLTTEPGRPRRASTMSSRSSRTSARPAWRSGCSAAVRRPTSTPAVSLTAYRVVQESLTSDQALLRRVRRGWRSPAAATCPSRSPTRTGAGRRWRLRPRAHRLPGAGPARRRTFDAGANGSGFRVHASLPTGGPR